MRRPCLRWTNNRKKETDYCVRLFFPFRHCLHPQSDRSKPTGCVPTVSPQQQSPFLSESLRSKYRRLSRVTPKLTLDPVSRTLLKASRNRALCASSRLSRKSIDDTSFYYVFITRRQIFFFPSCNCQF